MRIIIEPWCLKPPAEPGTIGPCALALLTLFIAPGFVNAEDVVHLDAAEPGQRALIVRGAIADWTGEAIVVRRASGGGRRYEAARIIRVETSWPAEYSSGQEAYAARDYPSAVRELQAALRREPRGWARRQIGHQLLLASESQGDVRQACEVFLNLVEEDRLTPAFRDAPLAWVPDRGLTRSDAEALLERRSPAAQLLGASHLLATNYRTRGETVLADLRKHVDPRIAGLAEAQLWRTKLLGVTPELVGRWSERIESLPVDVRAGPYFVVGQGWQRLNRHDEAILAYLRVPVLYPSRRALAARSLVSAARGSQQAGHVNEASRLLQEVLNEYPDKPEKTEAEQLLRSLRQD